MSKFVIEGGYRLQGEIDVQGSKNAALPVMAAAILGSGKSQIENVPDIADVRNFLRILEALGVKTEFAEHKLVLDPGEMRNSPLARELVGQMRGSILFAGALLGRFGRTLLAYPGGDAIGSRPIDVHVDGFRKLGAVVKESRDGLEIEGSQLRGAKIVLGVTSVTGTENLLLASVLADGITEIRLAATEPHVRNLCRFLNAMGAQVSGIGTTTLRINGVSALRGAKFKLCPDEIEAATFCVAAAATKGEVKVRGVDFESLDAPLNALESAGVNVETGGDWIYIRPPSGPYRSTKLITGVFPQLLTDEQPLFGVLATQAVGETSIHDWVYEGRQGYLRALREMGARVEFDDVHRARIFGPTQLRGAQITTPDIRAGASILIAALVAKGQSIIYNAEIIDRGYERFDERLNTLGAHIQRME